MLNETLKKALAANRQTTSVSLRIPVDVVDSLKAVAARRGYIGYRTLLKAYVSEGKRRDEGVFSDDGVERLARALKNHGVSAEGVDAALGELLA